MSIKIKKIIRRIFGISDVVFAFHNAFEYSKNKGYDMMYVFVDLHKTVLYPDYDQKFVTEFYPHAKRVLQQMSSRGDMKLIMYTCSHPEEISKYVQLFDREGIKFSFVNENPDVKGTEYGDFTGKPYMNVLLEDKAGFDAEEDWIKIEKLLNRYPKRYLKI